ncbi:MAG: heparan-alpha-glucosaminide N-acetyltransferase domain-containing protein [Alkalimonas sp.]|nr:heparan-alpha-glucosaminide N-acetyltransferase domain-containing protein [Alkalimonas sp.]
MAIQQSQQKTERFIALDALRGLALALMILVNTPGSWSHVYPSLLHAEWHGFTFADIVFPMFLFAVGAAMAFSMASMSPSVAAWQKIIKRTLLLFACGLLLHWFPFTGSITELRIPGVLQRIALCYGIAAVLVLYLRPRQLWLASVVLVGCYWLLLLLFASGQPYALAGNAVQRFDLWLLGPAHLYQGFGVAFDPEGLLSTLPAVSSVLIGYWVAQQLRSMQKLTSVYWLLCFGLSFTILGLLWHLLWPINKALWTGSYVAFSSGLILLLLAGMVWLLDVQQKNWLQPLVVYGSNPLFIYMLSWLWAVAASQLIRFSFAGQTTSLYQFGFDSLATLLPAKLASLVFALLHVLLFWLLSYWLYQRRIFIKL